MVDVAPLTLLHYDGRGSHAGPGGADSGSDDEEGGSGSKGDADGSGGGSGGSEGEGGGGGKRREKMCLQPTAVLVWFRGENVKEEAWAGDIRKAQARHQGVEMSPRESFKAIQEVLRCESIPWEVHEKSSAAAMQLMIRDTIGMCQQGQLSSRIMETLEHSAALYGNCGRGDANEFNTVAEELRTIIGTADIPVIKVNADLVISEHNKYAASLLMGPNRSAVGLTVTEFLEPNSVNVMQVTMRSAIAETVVEPKPMMLRFKLPGAGGKSAEQQLVEARKRAEEDIFTTHYREMLFFPQLRWGSSGQIMGIVLTGRDMSTHKSVMRSLEYASDTRDHTDEADHEDDLQNVIANAIVPVASIDCNGRVAHWNALMEFATGLSRKQAEGKLLVGELLGSKVEVCAL